MTSKTNDRASLSDEEIIERFGGIRPMATKLGVAVTTVQGWKNRGHIPENRRADILRAAATHGIDLGGTGDSAPAAPSEAAPEPEPASQPVGGVFAQAAKSESKSPTTAPASSAEFPHTPPQKPAPAGPARTPGREAASGGAGIRWLSLALAVAALAAVLSQPLWGPFYGSLVGPGDATDESTLQRLEAQGERRYDELRARLTALEAGGGEAGKAIADQIGRIENDMKGIKSTLNSIDSAASGLETRLATLEAARGEVPESVTASLREIATDTESLRAEIAALRQQIDAQEQALADGVAGLRRDVAALDKRVVELEARPAQTGEKVAALALAVGQVEAALRSGRPYRQALDRLATIATDDSMVQSGIFRLSQWADTGIPSYATLQRQFAEIAPSIDRALADSGGENWLERTWHSLSTVVTVRRVDGEGDVSPVSKAEAALADGDLASALAALDAAGPLGEAGDAWVEDARSRLFAETELQTLYGQVIAPLGAGAAGGSGK